METVKTVALKIGCKKSQVCPFCSISFPNFGSFQRHIWSHTREKPFKCDHCDFWTAFKRRLKTHIQMKHEDESVWQKRLTIKCELCPYKTYRQCLLRIHMHKHAETKNFRCKFSDCSFKAKFPGGYKHHYDVVHNQRRPVACTVTGCSYTGKTQLHLSRHMTSHSNERPFPCSVSKCEYKSKSRSALWSHLKNVHAKQPPDRFLEDAKLQTGNYDSMQTMQHADIKPFVCTFPNCMYRSKSKLYLQLHAARHAEVKPHTCPFRQCSFRTALKFRLAEHIKSHDQSRPFPCTFKGCKFRAKRKPNLKLHTQKHDQEFNIPCPIEGCTYLARYRTTLKAHVKRHRVLPYFKVCPEPGCNYWATKIHLLTKHEKIHRDGHLSSCPLCPKNFTSKMNLQHHIFSHTKEKPLQCVYCDYGSYENICMIRHYERKHQGKEFSSDWLKPSVMCKYSGFVGDQENILRHAASNNQKLVVTLERIRIKIV